MHLGLAPGNAVRQERHPLQIEEVRERLVDISDDVLEFLAKQDFSRCLVLHR